MKLLCRKGLRPTAAASPRSSELARPPFGVVAHPRSIGFASGLHWRRTPTLSAGGRGRRRRRRMGLGAATTTLHSDFLPRPLSLSLAQPAPAHSFQGRQERRRPRPDRQTSRLNYALLCRSGQNFQSEQFVSSNAVAAVFQKTQFFICGHFL